MDQWFLVLVLLFGLIFVVSVAPSKENCKCENLKSTDYRIVNGTSGPELEQGLAWIAFLFVEAEIGKKTVCTGSVISSRWVLTGNTARSDCLPASGS